jgi:hypothetical protein
MTFLQGSALPMRRKKLKNFGKRDASSKASETAQLSHETFARIRLETFVCDSNVASPWPSADDGQFCSEDNHWAVDADDGTWEDGGFISPNSTKIFFGC